jgi:hypothetical protein
MRSLSASGAERRAMLALFVLPDSPKKVGEYPVIAAQLRIPARCILLLCVSTIESVSYFMFFKDDRREKENFSGTPVL